MCEIEELVFDGDVRRVLVKSELLRGVVLF